MPVCRIEKTKNYTVMCNYHLNDKRINLKTKGLLSLMLSLPEEWDYSVKGLCKITGEGRDCIRTCLEQLERAGYLVRHQLRLPNGRMSAETEYIIYEYPISIEDIPTSVEPKSEKPKSVEPSSGNPTQINTQTASAVNQKTKSTNPPISDSEMDGPIDTPSPTYADYEQLIKDNVGYEMFIRAQARLDEQLDADEITLDEYDSVQSEINLTTVDHVINYMSSIVGSISAKPVTINGRDIPAEVVKSKLLKVDYPAFKRCVRELTSNPSIRNPKSYAISMLFNS